ncbi:hypothetical protein SUGI_0846770 [Cryptomeria japonica]|uniref:uncharacterized protein LOC131079532 n=1 Tax=Cryptomeria japonica TaxID=3369 RepID=UPI0024147C35|nr:uncharacterized protein LOC131079532 [Cryptomeria japonica]GLJ40933.1 hypothetical protein SUGI_0846770 [Cryptomeria japonica]
MDVKLTKLELMYGSLGKRLMFRSICFSMILALMPILYIVQDEGPCDLTAGSEPFYRPGGLGIESPTPTKIWALRPTVKFYSGIYSDLLKQGLLRPGLKGLCVGCHAAHAVLALRENGVPDATGIDRGSCKGKLKRLPFADNSFDFVLSASVDRARAPALFAVEIERTLKPNGVAIIVVCRRRGALSSNPLHSLAPTAALFRNSDVVHVTVAGNSSVIALRKLPLAPNPIHHCSPLKLNRSLVEFAEPLTENRHKAIYLPSILDISTLNRHVYVEIGVNDSQRSTGEWFLRAYPKQNMSFKIYAVSVDNTAPASVSALKLSGLEEVSLNQSEIGGWMKRNMSEKDFVVVKLGFPYARELLDSGAICLVDELFVECSHDDDDDDAACLHLLNALRKNGVFAHKW